MYTQVAVKLKPLHLIKGCIFYVYLFLTINTADFLKQKWMFGLCNGSGACSVCGVDYFEKGNVPSPIEETYIHYFHYCAQKSSFLDIPNHIYSPRPPLFIHSNITLSSKPKTSKISLAFSSPPTEIMYLFFSPTSVPHIPSISKSVALILNTKIYF